MKKSKKKHNQKEQIKLHIVGDMIALAFLLVAILILISLKIENISLEKIYYLVFAGFLLLFITMSVLIMDHIFIIRLIGDKNDL